MFDDIDKLILSANLLSDFRALILPNMTDEEVFNFLKFELREILLQSKARQFKSDDELLEFLNQEWDKLIDNAKELKQNT
ncbi:hypothetical protein [Avibacterium avium]|uniref:hypothetical protein n=1 Tax=Avibacterium avium TaxID=751 RepID=UPI003BF86EED